MSTSVGYTGGSSRNPTYEEVCQQPNGDGHTEAIRVVFDSEILLGGYEELMRRFFAEATPNIRRKQYQSAVWAQSPEQFEIATKVARELGKEDGVAVLAAAEWHEAEDRHQKYYERLAAPRVCRRL